VSSRFYRANVLEKLALLDRDEELKLLAFLASLAGLPRDSCLGEQLPDRAPPPPPQSERTSL